MNIGFRYDLYLRFYSFKLNNLNIICLYSNYRYQYVSVCQEKK